jgi:Fic/DOC family
MLAGASIYQVLLLRWGNIVSLVACLLPGARRLSEIVALPHPAGRLEFARQANRAHLSRLAKSGRAVRLATGIYVVDGRLPPDVLARHHAMAIAATVWPGAVLCDRSAFAGPVPTEGWLYLCQPRLTRRSDLLLPGMTISPRVGPEPCPGDVPLPGGLFQAGFARSLTENVTTSGRPPRGRPARQAGTRAVEDRIDEMARTGGAGRIRNVLGELDVIAAHFDHRAVELVRRRLTAVLGSASGDTPVSQRLQARLAGHPYDEHRIQVLSSLVTTLNRTAPEPVPELGPATRWQWLAFFEAYFSNFIEGTEFGVEEARSIAVDGFVPAERPADAHDVAATYRLVSDPTIRSRVPATGDELLDLLREQHAILLAARQDKRPGLFKSKPNYAGGYEFVAPQLLEGTLKRGFAVLDPLTDPFQRAVALMFLITESHPFDDGNGRIARAFSNAALTAGGQVRIIIPTVYRNNYLAALSGLSNQAGAGESLIAVLRFAQRWTARIDWSGYEHATEQLGATNAFTDPGLADRTGQRLTLPQDGTGTQLPGVP